MKKLDSGSFFGVTKQEVQYNGLIIADMVTPAPKAVPWHYHENPYFTYFLGGHMVEVNKKQSLDCTPGTLIFHNAQAPHYNTKHSNFTHFFHMELNGEWQRRHNLKLSDFQNNILIEDPYFKSLFNRIYHEVQVNDSVSCIAVESLVLQLFTGLVRKRNIIKTTLPAWVKKVREIVQDQSSESLSLTSLSNQLGIGPTYLSQSFSRYFNTTLSEYIRRVRVDKATSLLSVKHLSLTDIALTCGFADQSHFIRCFKQINGMTPSAYRKIIFRS